MKTNKFKATALLSVIALAFGLTMTSCNREEVLTDTTTSATEAINLSAARVAATTDSVTKKRSKGHLIAVDAASLPATITTYIGTNYAGSEIRFAGKDSANTSYVVGLKLADGTHKGLLFNIDGTFNKELVRYPKGAKLTEVAIADIPTAIAAYIATNYKGATIKKAGKNDEGQYHVAITLADATVKVIVFNTDFSFKEERTKGNHPEKNGKGRGR